MLATEARGGKTSLGAVPTETFGGKKTIKRTWVIIFKRERRNWSKVVSKNPREKRGDAKEFKLLWEKSTTDIAVQ